MRAASDERAARCSNASGAASAKADPIGWQRRTMRDRSRREMLQWAASASLVSLLANFGWAEDADDQPIAFLDADKVMPAKGGMLNWNELNDWVIPTKDLYHVSHYGVAQVKEEGYKLSIDGLFDKPQTLTLDQIKSRPAQEHTVTLESGGNGNPGLK